MSSDRRVLPERPNLEQYRKQAKELIRALAAGDPEAIARIARSLSSRNEADSDSLKLADAQRVIALEHGFESWPSFRKHVAKLLTASPLATGDAIRVNAGPFGGMTGTVEEILAHRREVRTRLEVQGRPTQVWLSPEHLVRV